MGIHGPAERSEERDSQQDQQGAFGSSHLRSLSVGFRTGDGTVTMHSGSEGNSSVSDAAAWLMASASQAAHTAPRWGDQVRYGIPKPNRDGASRACRVGR